MASLAIDIHFHFAQHKKRCLLLGADSIRARPAVTIVCIESLFKHTSSACVREAPYANCSPRMPLSALPLFVCVLRFFFWQHAVAGGSMSSRLTTQLGALARIRRTVTHTHSHSHTRIYYNRTQEGEKAHAGDAHEPRAASQLIALPGFSVLPLPRWQRCQIVGVKLTVRSCKVQWMPSTFTANACE